MSHPLPPTPDLVPTPDHRLRVFVSSTLRELAPERVAVREAVTHLRLAPVMFENGARAHPPRRVYRSYLAQSHVFVGVYGDSYGWTAPGEEVSGLEDEYLASAGMPRLIYVRRPAPDREERLSAMLGRIRADDSASYTAFSTPDELRALVENDLAMLLTERFEQSEARAPDPAPPALPVPPTPIVGREAETAVVTRLLGNDEVRLVTLTGPGGVGKSRLALEVAASLAPDFPDGVAFVELAAVTRAEFVAPSIATTLDLAAPSSRAPWEDVVAFLRDRRMLLVLDNLEQVASAAPLLADLLARARGLTVLATSRSGLRIRSEHAIDVSPLAVPAPSDALGVLEHVAAVRLFLARARAVSADFTLTDGNAPIIAAIVRRLDGLPLAIELAAAQVRLLPPTDLLARLDRRLSVFSGAPLDLPERQRTLRATISWSHDLLAAPQQLLFARLGAFAGGFTLAAVEALDAGSNDHPRPPEEIVEVLGSLVEASLVRREDRDGETRFGMLDTVREYARERLREGGQSDDAHDAHARYYSSLAEQAEPQLEGPDQLDWLDRLEHDRDNLRLAMTRLIESGALDDAVRLGWALWRFWYLRGHVEEGVRWFRDILERETGLSAYSRARALSAAGLLTFGHGDIAEGESLLRRALPLGREVADRQGTARALGALAQVAAARGEPQTAREYLAESLALSGESRDEWFVAFLHDFYGQLALDEKDFATADGYFAKALAVARRSGDRLAILYTIYALAEARLHGGDDASAEVLLDEGLSLARETGDVASAAVHLGTLASVAEARGDDETAARLSGAADAARRDGGRGCWLAAFNARGAGQGPDLPALRQRLGITAFDEARHAGAADCATG